MFGCSGSVVLWCFTAYSSFAHKLCVALTFSPTDKDLFDRIYLCEVEVLVGGGETGFFVVVVLFPLRKMATDF